MDSNRGNPMASRKHTFRLLWQTVFPYEIRWGIEEVGDEASAHDVKNLTRTNAPTHLCDRAGSGPDERGHLTLSHNPEFGDSEIRQRAS